jgi:predicted transcriptional regulator with HTH domain
MHARIQAKFFTQEIGMTLALSDDLIFDSDTNPASSNAILSLRKSAVRRSVLRYLVSIHPAVTYLSSISRSVHYSSSQVYGALMGIREAYEPLNSLCTLGLVERVANNPGGIRCVYYRATPLGCSVFEDLESR